VKIVIKVKMPKGFILKNLEKVQLENHSDGFAVRFVLECTECKHVYNADFLDTKEATFYGNAMQIPNGLNEIDHHKLFCPECKKLTIN